MSNEYEFDAVRWLRNNAQVAANYENNAMAIYLTECADEIQRLRAENATLRKESEFYRAQCDMRDEWRDKIEAELAALKEALKPFADEACEYDPDEGDDGLFAFDTTIKIGQLRAARRALEEK